ncbi:MAG: hypothetical protein ACRD5L_06420, partial [Bryobacteraceae bacterium]
LSDGPQNGARGLVLPGCDKGSAAALAGLPSDSPQNGAGELAFLRCNEGSTAVLAGPLSRPE